MSYWNNDRTTIADLTEALGEGFSVSPPVPYDHVGMNWANGRRCTDTPDPGPIPPPDVRWADGTPIQHGPHTPIAWRAMLAAHGLPVRLATTDNVGA